MDAFRSELTELIVASQNITLTSHMSPDDDSIGSILSTYKFLKAEYPEKNIRMIYSGTPVPRFRSFSDFDAIEFVDDVANHVADTDLLIMVDASQYARFSNHPELLSKVPRTAAIDHHASVPDTFTILLQESSFTSCAQMIYHLFYEGKEISKDAAECMLLGILGDTGNFAYVPPAQSGVFLIAKTLLETVGTSIDVFRSRYGAIPERILPLLKALASNMEFGATNDWPAYLCSYIDRDLVVSRGYTDEDISAASHIFISQYITRVEGHKWGFVVTPRSDGSCRVSSRSLPGSVNVRLIHEGMNIGSGHDRASGGFFAESDPEVCVGQIKAWMHKNAPVFQ